ncbi:dash complex subunit dad1 protein [Stemphylium lycopersici]|uniref:DASH complex subunit DAD1 n=1 Tax=Stemphylium lycopersici TaxID=183478 RepID=A0A364N2J9_STELY|nr:dash complex subunit dad1 protein [Stemphylium lycopersici]
MAPPYFPGSTNGQEAAPPKTYYEQQREMLVTEIAQSLEVVLQNINKLNRSLEEVTSVGNEFAPVESLWSHFENVMAKDASEQHEGTQEGATEHEGETEVPEERK